MHPSIFCIIIAQLSGYFCPGSHFRILDWTCYHLTHYCQELVSKFDIVENVFHCFFSLFFLYIYTLLSRCIDIKWTPLSPNLDVQCYIGHCRYSLCYVPIAIHWEFDNLQMIHMIRHPINPGSTPVFNCLRRGTLGKYVISSTCIDQIPCSFALIHCLNKYWLCVL